MDPSWPQFLFGAIGAGGVVFGFTRGRRQDSDARIDERIKLNVGVTLAEMKAGIEAIRRELPHDFASRVSNSEQEIRRHAQDLDELFKRLREHEMKGGTP